VSLVRKILFALFVTAAFAGGIYGYFALKNNKTPDLKSLWVVPDSCMAYTGTARFHELAERISSRSLVLDNLRMLPQINHVCSNIRYFDSVIQTQSVLRDNLEDQLLHIAFYKSGWLGTCNISHLGEQKETEAALVKSFNAVVYQNRVYVFDKQGSKNYFAITSGVVMVSNSIGLITKATDKRSAKFVNSTFYVEMKEALAENAIPFIYLNHGLLPKKKSFLPVVYPFNKGISGGVAEILPAELKMNGNFIADTSELIHRLHSQSPAVLGDILQTIPISAVSFTAYGFTTFTPPRSTGSTQQFWQRMNERSLFNLKASFYENLGGSVVTMKIANGRAVCVKVSDTLKGRESLAMMLNSQPGTAEQTDSITGGERILEPYSDVLCNFGKLVNGYLVFAEDQQTLNGYVSAAKDNNMLGAQPQAAAYFNDNVPETINYLQYENLAKTALGGRQGNVNKLTHSVFSLVNGKSHFVYRFHLQYAKENAAGDGVNALWTARLTAPCITAAYGFRNHKSNENEFVVQDKENQLYLLSSKGSVIWKRSLDEPLSSPVYTVDIFKNGKLQMAFSTTRKIMLIDRNGKDVEGFPITLRDKAASPLTLLDYEGNKDYRFFISCYDNKIYNYSADGKLQAGFIPVVTDALCRLPVQYARVGASDYLVTADESGRVYTFSRKGVARIGLRNRAARGVDCFSLDVTNRLAKTFLYYANSQAGIIETLSFEDRKETLRGIDVAECKVSFVNVDENKNLDALVIKDNTVSAYDMTGGRIFSRQFPSSISHASWFADESHRILFALSASNGKLYVYKTLSNKTVTVEADQLPLVTDLFHNNRLYIIIPHGEKVQCIPLDE
jgi:hypothetical protein